MLAVTYAYEAVDAVNGLFWGTLQYEPSPANFICGDNCGLHSGAVISLTAFDNGGLVVDLNPSNSNVSVSNNAGEETLGDAINFSAIGGNGASLTLHLATQNLSALNSTALPATIDFASFTFASISAFGGVGSLPRMGPLTRFEPAASVTGVAWDDLNGNGVREGGEAGLGGVTVELIEPTSNLTLTTLTEADGSYTFENVLADLYTVRFVQPDDYQFTLQDAESDDDVDSDVIPATGEVSIVLAAGDSVTGVDAGLYVPASVGDFVWRDLNGNGIQDVDEPGLADVAVDLLDAESQPLGSTTTGVDGFYEFSGLPPGDYFVQFFRPDGFEFAPQDAAGDDVDSDADQLSGQVAVTLESGDMDTSVDAGLFLPCIEVGPLCAAGLFDEATPGRFESFGTALLGRAPTQGEPFTPLVSIDGVFWFDEQTIHADGITRARIGAAGEALLDGVWEIAVGQAATQSLTDRAGLVTDEFSPVGLGYRVSGFSLTDPSGGATNDSQIELDGTLTLPGELGGFDLPLLAADRLIIDSGGVRPAGASVSFPNVAFSLLDLLQVQATDLNVEFLSNPLELKIQGVVNVPTLHGVAANFAGNNFILVRDDPGPGQNKVDVVGQLSVNDIVLTPGVWEIKNPSLTINTVDRTVGGAASFRFPGGWEVDGELEFIADVNGEWHLNMGLFGLDNLSTPLGATGFVLRSIAGGLDHIAVADPNPLTYLGQAGATYGPVVNITLPGWAGGPFSGSLLQVDVEASINEEQFQGNGTLSYLNGVIDGEGDLTIDWTKGFSQGIASLDFLNGFITANARLFSDASLNVTMFGQGALTVPDELVDGLLDLAAGQTFAAGTVYFQYRHDAAGANDFVLAYGQLPMPFGDPITLGAQVDFDGNVRVIRSAAELPPVQLPPPAGEGENSAEQTFAAPADLARLILVAQWENAAPTALIELVAPDGRVIPQADFDNESDIAIIDDLSGDTSTAVAITNPAVGNWTIRVPDKVGLGAVGFQALIDTAAPTAAITDLRQNLHNVTIDYEAEDPDSDAQVNLYFDTDGAGFDGGVIIEGLIDSDGPGSYVWDTEQLPAGEYHVYALVNDGDNALASAYSLGSVGIRTWLNPRNALDVTDDGVIAPDDALAIINRLLVGGPGQLSGSPGQPARFVDTTGDNFLAVDDALRVVNALILPAPPAAGQGEGESTTGNGLAQSQQVFADVLWSSPHAESAKNWRPDQHDLRRGESSASQRTLDGVAAPAALKLAVWRRDDSIQSSINRSSDARSLPSVLEFALLDTELESAIHSIALDA